MATNIPGDIVAPLLAFDVESAGLFSSETRMILLGHGLAGAALAAGAIALCTTVDQARYLAGRGSMLESMFIRARQNAPAQEIYLARVDDSGTAEVRTVTVGTPPAAGGQGILQVAGERVAVQIAASSSASTVAAQLAAAINGFFNALTKKSLPFTATVVGAVVTLTARHRGAYAGGLDLFVPVTDGVNAFSGLLTFATATAGAGAPDLAPVLAAMGDDPFEIMVSAFGDDTSRLLLDQFLSSVSGRWSYAQQLYGHAFYPRTGTVAELTTWALARDSWHLTMIPVFSNAGNGTPAYEFVTALVARIASFLGSGVDGRVSANQSGLVVEGVLAPRDRNYWPDYATRDALLKNSVSAWKVDVSGNVLIDKIVTQQQTTNGVPDTALRDIQAVYQITYALKYVRAQLAFEHSNKAIVDDNPADLPTLVTARDIQATLVTSTMELARRGVIEATEAAFAEIRVTRNADNRNRVDMVLPLDRANPLDIFAGLARVYA
ncbi:hypothetical protein BJF92_12180 [Rhizobium rhizosphaerae]|uniref:Mu-like prophage tail sheath protein gpL n=1 Tax=Xaviernesmea rhizosphaerae TaxID=1672749 RepID=A0A1Q9AN44_9HYPH|nr:hypothetical protein [Xaviernesmea rhizosphaerae]OLP56822.1 hypothetical protein BJF92_12180 [Xaviernesmea rhizosphaerae]